MDKRAAKREACFRAANLVRSAQDTGWPGEFYSPEDYNAVVGALGELAAELARRGWKADQ